MENEIKKIKTKIGTISNGIKNLKDNAQLSSLEISSLNNKIDNLDKTINELSDYVKNMHIGLQNSIIHEFAVSRETIRKLNTVAILHQKTFMEFKNCHKNDALVIVGAGPSINQLDISVLPQNAKYIGLNRAFLYESINFDYLFAIDKIGIEKWYDAFIAYKEDECIKFVGDQDINFDFQIPEQIALKVKNVRRYKTTTKTPFFDFIVDIDSQPLFNSYTVSLQAMQFALYTNPKEIYLVGIDCTGGTQGHFMGQSANLKERGENPEFNDTQAISDWKRIKEFIETYYPETRIISVNPVGLRGTFEDIG